MKWVKSLLSFPSQESYNSVVLKNMPEPPIGEDFRRLAELKHRLLLDTCKHERCTRNRYKIRNTE